MMDVVIPLRDRPSLYNDQELRYCLRSIDKYMDVRDVWCVGLPRDWLSVNWIQQGDLAGRYHSRHESVRRKIIAACDNPFISDPFILFNDDFYLLREIDEIHDYYDGTIDERISSTGGGYMLRMQESAKYSKDGLNYEVHAPCLVYKDLFKEVTKEGALYRNIYCSHSPTEKVEMKDCKMYGRESHIKFKEFLKGKWMFSSGEISFYAIHSHMERLYPDKSRWE